MGSVKRLNVVHGGDSCTLLLFEKTDPAALVHALTSRFRLGQLHFHLTYRGDDAIVPLCTAIPDGQTLSLCVDGEALRERSGLISQDTPMGNSDQGSMLNSTVEPVISTQSFAGNEEEHGSTQGIAMKTIPAPGFVATSKPESCTPLLQEGFREERHSAGAAPVSSQLAPRESLENHGPRTSSTVGASSKDVLDSECHPRSSEMSFHEHSTISMTADAMTNAVQKIDRFSRLSSELANERTLLAWIRTGLAAIRTVFTFLSLAAITEGWKYLIIFTEMAMMTVVLFAGLSGTIRYFRVRKALRLPDPPDDFGRVSIMWFNGMIVIASLAMAAGIYTQHWVHAKD